MRQIFTSQRVETVEGVAKLLTDAGIQVHISNGRSYQSGRGGQFSFLDPVKPSRQPTLWVKLPEDQPRARDILRQAGLLDSTRPGQYASLNFTHPAEERPRRSWAWRIRIALLVVIAGAALLTVMRHRETQPLPVQEEEEIRIRIAPAS